MALGGAIGIGSDFQGVGLAIGGVVGGKIFSNLKELPQSFVLAISPTTVYVLGRDKQAPFGGWDKLQPMIKFDRDKLRVEISQHLVTLDITLVDTEHDATLELEAKRLGTPRREGAARADEAVRRAPRGRGRRRDGVTARRLPCASAVVSVVPSRGTRSPGPSDVRPWTNDRPSRAGRCR